MPVPCTGLDFSAQEDSRCVVLLEVVGLTVLWYDLQHGAIVGAEWLIKTVQYILIYIEPRPTRVLAKLGQQRAQRLEHRTTVVEVRMPGNQRVDTGIGLHEFLFLQLKITESRWNNQQRRVNFVLRTYIDLLVSGCRMSRLLLNGRFRRGKSADAFETTPPPAKSPPWQSHPHGAIKRGRVEQSGGLRPGWAFGAGRPFSFDLHSILIQFWMFLYKSLT